jgi:uncharacterized protein YjbJ (UPF0337 family)
MNDDRIEGTARTVGGKVQEAAGRITGDAKTRVEGEINQAAGRAQNLYGQARDAAADAVEAIPQVVSRYSGSLRLLFDRLICAPEAVTRTLRSRAARVCAAHE